ncbi:hypothetical protein AB0D30_21795 [Streptomyces sp. NPDC048409]|uniref:hypothetical protein n=1 Tax=Streptomyces sp. NPDC048409 TaxID=3154723 RepID=UPI00343768D8
MNQVERWFGLLTDKLIRRGVHTSVKALEDDITARIDTWNETPLPFTRTKTADEILNSSSTTSARSEPSARKQSRTNPQDFWRMTPADLDITLGAQPRPHVYAAGLRCRTRDQLSE